MHKKFFVYNSDIKISEQPEVTDSETKQLSAQKNDNIEYETQVVTVVKSQPQISKKIPQTLIKQNTVKTDIKKTVSNTTVTKTEQQAKPADKIQNKDVFQEKFKRSTELTSEKNFSYKNEQNKIINSPSVTQENSSEDSGEKLILWNKWRSDIQNRIMQDVKLPVIQEGIIFKFSFDADKYGKITNIKTYSTTPEYTPYAIQYIAPVIRSYQGKDILNFPTGSERYITTVEGAWKISKNGKFSTPQDFNDTEKSKK